MGTISIFSALTYISMFIVLLPITIVIYKYKTLNLQLRVLFLYLIIGALADILNYWLASNGKYNYSVRQGFTILECIAILRIFSLEFRGKKILFVIRLFFTVFVILSIAILGFNRGLFKNDNILTSCESCFIIFLTLYYFYKDITERSVPLWSEAYFFWLNSAFLIYFGINFFLFLFSGLIEKTESNIFELFRGVALASNIAYYLLLSMGIWKVKEN